MEHQIDVFPAGGSVADDAPRQQVLRRGVGQQTFTAHLGHDYLNVILAPRRITNWREGPGHHPAGVVQTRHLDNSLADRHTALIQTEMEHCALVSRALWWTAQTDFNPRKMAQFHLNALFKRVPHPKWTHRPLDLRIGRKGRLPPFQESGGPGTQGQQHGNQQYRNRSSNQGLPSSRPSDEATSGNLNRDLVAITRPFDGYRGVF